MTSEPATETEGRIPSPSPSLADAPLTRARPSDAARGARLFERDARGRPVTWRDSSGVEIGFTHDAHGNLRRLTSGDWFVAIEGAGPEQSFAVCDQEGRTAVHFERGGRLRTIQRDSDTLSIEFDADERIHRVVVPGSDQALVYDWDETGGCRIRSAGGTPLMVVSGGNGLRRYALDHSTWWEESLDLARVELRAAIDETVCDTLVLAIGGLAQVTERRWGDGSGDRFERDAEGRIAAWTCFDAGGDGETFKCRYAGADLAESPSGRRTMGVGGRIDALDRPDGVHITYRYDAAGRRIARTGPEGETRYQYDPLGALIDVTTPDGTRTCCAFDGMGRRIAVRRCGDTAWREHRDEAGRLWAITDADGRARHVYIWIGTRIAARIDGPVGAPIAEGYLCDPLGTPMGALVASPGDGWRFERIDAPPFGRTDGAARPTLYGHFADPVTGLVHFGAREYDPELGLFLTPDPWHGGIDDPRRWSGAPEALIARERPIEGFHDYALCRFDPLGRVDRDGHSAANGVVHVVRWILSATWGFPLTAVSLFFFEPFNLYAELVGLIIWAFKQACEDKSHPWGNHTIAGATWGLASSRQMAFALGLNGFLPRVVSGRSLNADRAVTVGNVIWIHDEELEILGRAEVVEVYDMGGTFDGAGNRIVDIAGKPIVPSFNDDFTKVSLVALLATDKDGKQRIHASQWTRGFGNAVALRNSVQAFTDTPAAGAVRSAIHLLRPVPLGFKLPGTDSDPEKLEIREFVPPAAAVVPAKLETAAAVWFSLKLPKDTTLKSGDWLKVSAPKATPLPEPCFVRVRDLLPAPDHVALLLNAELPARFVTAKASADLRIDLTALAAHALPSPNWVNTPATPTLLRLTSADAGSSPDIATDAPVAIVAPAKVPGVAVAGLPLPPDEDTRYTLVKAIRPRLKLAPDAAGAALEAALTRMEPSLLSFGGVVAKKTDRAKITLTAPFPEIAENDLLVVSRGAGASAYVRAKAPPASGVLDVDPPLDAAMVPADGTALDLQIAKPSADVGTGTATIARIPATLANQIDATVPGGSFFKAGNLVSYAKDGVPQLRRIESIAQIELEVVDAPVGVGPYKITRAATSAGSVRNGVELAPPGRFLKWTGGTALSALGKWPDSLLAIEFPSGAAPGETAAHYVQWPAPGGRPGTMHPDYHQVWTAVTQGADQFMVLESPLPLVRRKNDAGEMKTWWRGDIDDHSGRSDKLFEPPPIVPPAIVPPPIVLHATDHVVGAVRVDAPGRRILAGEPEALVPDAPTVHETHRRALIEHELHHTVQTNFWGPMMTALPISGLVMSVFDIAGADGADIPDWLKEVDRDAHGNPPASASGRIDHNTELNPFQVFSLGGLLQLAWKYIYFSPFRKIPGFADTIDNWDFKDFEKVFDPFSAFVTGRLPQVDPNAPAGTRWIEALGQLLSKAFDLRSWTPFIGFVPTLLPDGATNFIEQGASRASGDLYSTILTANDRFNLRTRGRFSGQHFDRSANIQAGPGTPVRLLMFSGSRGHRVFAKDRADIPGTTIYHRNEHQEPLTIELPPGPRWLVDDELYEVRPASGVLPAKVMIEGPPPLHTPAAFVPAVAGDVVVPRLRSLVPLPPRVNRSIGFYLIGSSPRDLTVKAAIPFMVDAEIEIGGTIGAGGTVTATATSASLPGSPVVIGPVAAAPGDTAAGLAKSLASAIVNDQAMKAIDLRTSAAGGTVSIYLRRSPQLGIVWTVQAAGGVSASATSGRVAEAAKEDPATETVTITIIDDVKLDDEPIIWTEPLPAAAVPAVPPPAPALKRFQTEECVLRIRLPKPGKPGEFVDAGTDNFVLDVADPTMLTPPKPGDMEWKLKMPVAVPGAPVRLRLFRVIKKTDPSFDLVFADVPSLKDRRSYLETNHDRFVVVRDVLLGVEALPQLPLKPPPQPFNVPFELKLPIRLPLQERGIIVTPPDGFDLPKISLIGDDGRGQKWSIGPLAEPPGAAAVFKVDVIFDRGATIIQPFELTFKATI